MPTVLKSGNLNLLEPSGPDQACNGIALPYIFTVVCTYLWGSCCLVGALNTSLSSILSRTSIIFSSYPSPNSMRHCSSIENVACSVDLRWVAFPVFGWFLRHGHCLSTSQRLAWNRNKIDKMCVNRGMALVDRNGANMSCSDTSVSIRKWVCSRYISCVFLLLILYIWSTRWRSWLRHCATSRKVAGSIPDCVIGFFHWHNPSGRTLALGLTQPLTEMSTRNVSWG